MVWVAFWCLDALRYLIWISGVANKMRLTRANFDLQIAVLRFWDSKAKKIRIPPNSANFENFGKFGPNFSWVDQSNNLNFDRNLTEFERIWAEILTKHKNRYSKGDCLRKDNTRHWRRQLNSWVFPGIPNFFARQ